MDNREATALLLSATVFNRIRTVVQAVQVLRVWQKVLEEYGNSNFVFVPLVTDRYGQSFRLDLDYLVTRGLVYRADQNGTVVYGLTDKGRNAILLKMQELNRLLGLDIVALIGIDAKVLQGIVQSA